MFKAHLFWPKYTKNKHLTWCAEIFPAHKIEIAHVLGLILRRWDIWFRSSVRNCMWPVSHEFILLEEINHFQHIARSYFAGAKMLSSRKSSVFDERNQISGMLLNARTFASLLFWAASSLLNLLPCYEMSILRRRKTQLYVSETLAWDYCPATFCCSPNPALFADNALPR